MAGASPHLTLRAAAFAGSFYPADAAQCRQAAQSLLASNGPQPPHSLRAWTGAIVPHAGWICSGAVAAEAIATVAGGPQTPDVVVVFGAVHSPVEVDFAAFDSHEAWAVPGGETRIATAITHALAGKSGGLFAVEERLHRREHAVEVELPLIQQAWPSALLLPIEVPAIEQAVEIGRRTAEEISAAGLQAVYLASSDLTHYGPSYRFTPAGVGREALQWAMANDQRLLERVVNLDAERIVTEARQNANACGPGAVAAMLAACRDVTGATTARLLRHTNSYETLANVIAQPATDAVGYAAVVIG